MADPGYARLLQHPPPQIPQLFGSLPFRGCLFRRYRASDIELKKPAHPGFPVCKHCLSANTAKPKVSGEPVILFRTPFLYVGRFCRNHRSDDPALRKELAKVQAWSVYRRCNRMESWVISSEIDGPGLHPPIDQSLHIGNHKDKP